MQRNVGKRMRTTIADDEVAISYCGRIKAIRVKEKLSQVELGQKLGVSAHTISRMELMPKELSYTIYDIVARQLNWPMYVHGRKLSTGVQKAKVESPRQMTIDYSKAEITPAEGLSVYLASLDEPIPTNVHILAEFYRVSEGAVMEAAVVKYLKEHEDTLEYLNERSRYDDELRKKKPV